MADWRDRRQSVGLRRCGAAHGCTGGTNVCGRLVSRYCVRQGISIEQLEYRRSIQLLAGKRPEYRSLMCAFLLPQNMAIVEQAVACLDNEARGASVRSPTAARSRHRSLPRRAWATREEPAAPSSRLAPKNGHLQGYAVFLPFSTSQTPKFFISSCTTGRP
jgi:hypothetical protein